MLVANQHAFYNILLGLVCITVELSIGIQPTSQNVCLVYHASLMSGSTLYRLTSTLLKIALLPFALLSKQNSTRGCMERHIGGLPYPDVLDSFEKLQLLDA